MAKAWCPSAAITTGGTDCRQLSAACRAELALNHAGVRIPDARLRCHAVSRVQPSLSSPESILSTSSGQASPRAMCMAAVKADRVPLRVQATAWWEPSRWGELHEELRQKRSAAHMQGHKHVSMANHVPGIQGKRVCDPELNTWAYPLKESHRKPWA